jgi:putative PEP-CTERM system histidine kinase
MATAVVIPLSTIGLGLCGAAYLTLLVLLAVRSRAQGSGRLLLVAVAAEVLWGASYTLVSPHAERALLLQGIAESSRNAAWIAFMISLVVRSRTLLATSIIVSFVPLVSDLSGWGTAAAFSTRLLVAVVALVCLEQLWRNTGVNRRWAMKFLCLALLAKFAFDLVFFSDALLFGRPDLAWWTARGFANALLVPLIAVSAARNREWRLDVGVSREVVFHSATLLICGIFLSVVALGGYVLKYFGGTWGAVAAALLAFATVVGSIVLLSSGTVRSALRVQLAKHFFSYRYDYRREWLTLTRNLIERDETEQGSGSSSARIAQRGLKCLADLVESPGGVLWLLGEDGLLRCETRLGRSEAPPALAADAAWLDTFREKEEIVDLRSSAQDPNDIRRTGTESHTQDAERPAWLASDPQAAFILPLMLDRVLVGLVLLDRPRIRFELDWEARDLLRIAARQVAGYLTVRRTVEALVQARQFESFNKMSAFVAHDLKNLVAQMSLMLRNADRHKGNPEFQQDMLDTVRNVLERMQTLMLQLATGAAPVDPARAVSLTQAIRAAVRSRDGMTPTVKLDLDPMLEDLEVTAHKDRLERVVGHLIQNAKEATGADGSVTVRTKREPGQAVIQITDNGPGMGDDFIRERLFRPFSSTKANGMGIGVFESSEYIREIAGSIEVASTVGLGTTFTIRLPERAAGERTMSTSKA